MRVEFIMELIKLEDSMKLDIQEIDSQHEALIRLINQLHETMLQGTGRAALDKILLQLLEHTRSHFADEEQLMLQNSYPGYETHKAEHMRLMQHLSDLAERYLNGDILLSFAIVMELKDWAVIHIQKSDKPLGVFLHNRNEAASEATD